MFYTRKGDRGTSGLFRPKKRFSKSSKIYDALGTLDELNSLLGICWIHTKNIVSEISIPKEIRKAQEVLFIIQAELAGSNKCIGESEMNAIESTIDNVETFIGNLRPAFIIPGATTESALLDYTRTVARRAERSVVAVSTKLKVSANSLAYLNRLSSLLYILARYIAAREGIKETSPSY